MNYPIPLEDSWSDVIEKARRGLQLDEEVLAERSGLSTQEVRDLEKGELNPDHLAQVTRILNLDTKRLLALTRGEYHPGLLELPSGLVRFTSPWHNFDVHSYLLWDQNSLQAAAFDTGSDCSEMLEFLKIHSLKLTQIFVTHGHGDHIFELDRLIEKTGATAWIGERESVEEAKNFPIGKEFTVGSLKIETRSTWGHSVGGISYVIHGMNQSVAIVGDAIFAGSMGRPMVSYAACLETNRKELFSLPTETLLCPGHGPITTVALEKANNPFFP